MNISFFELKKKELKVIFTKYIYFQCEHMEHTYGNLDAKT